MVAVHQRGAKETLYFPLCHHHGTIPPSSSTQQNVEKDVVWWWLRTSTTETTRQTNKSCFPIFCLKKPTILFLLRFVFFKEGRRGFDLVGLVATTEQQLASTQRRAMPHPFWGLAIILPVWGLTICAASGWTFGAQYHQLQLPANNHISHLIKTSQ